MDKLVIQLYKQGFYDSQDMKLFVQVNWITPDQYKEVTGIDYVPTTGA